MHHLSPFKFRWLGVACVAIAVAVCGTLAGGAAGQGHATKSVTITLWYETQGPGYEAGFKAISAAWNKAHPGIQVELVGKSTTALADQEPLALRTSSGPCIPESWQLGYGTLGRMVKDKSLLPLNKYAKKYGWNAKVGSSLLAQASFTPDGATWGKGNLYALPFDGGALGLFYNKQKLEALHLSVPKTFEQFVSDLNAAKQGGEVPLMLGDAQGFPLLHDYQLFVNANGGGKTWSNFVYGIGHGTAKFSSPSVLAGATFVQTLGKDGLVNSDHSGTQLLDMVNRFAKGEGVFMITGTWFAAQLQNVMKSNVGFMAMPGVHGQPSLTNGDGTPWAISASCKYPDQAAQFLNYMVSPAATKMLLKAGGFPVVPVSNSTMRAAGISPTSAVGQGIVMFGKLAKAGSLLPFLDWSTPSMLQTADANLQLLINGKTDPQGFAAAVQKDYDNYWKK